MDMRPCSLCGQPAEFLSRQNTNDLFEDHLILPWETDQLPKYAEDLENHIAASPGRGPVEPTPSRGRP